MITPNPKHLASQQRGDRQIQLACVNEQTYQTTVLDCPTDSLYPPDAVSREEAKAFVLSAGPERLHYHVNKEDLLRLGFDEDTASEWITILDAGWITVSAYEPSKNPRLPYMVSV